MKRTGNGQSIISDSDRRSRRALDGRCDLCTAISIVYLYKDLPPPAMPTKTKAQMYDELVELGEFHLAVALLLEDDNFEAEFERASRPLAEDEDSGEGDLDETTISELLQYAAVDWMSIADSFYSSGPGSRGPYTGIPKSLDFFSCCLQAPDRAFRHMFRYAAGSSFTEQRLKHYSILV